MAYEFLAGCYDAFTADVHYARWADYLEKHFARSRLPIRTVLDRSGLRHREPDPCSGGAGL